MAPSSVLILARDPMTGALIGTLVEVSGLDPEFPRASEALDAAVARVRPGVVLVDCDAPDVEDCGDVAARYGGRVILFSPARRAPEVQTIAGRRGVPYFVLPVSWTEFRRLLRAVTAPADPRAAADQRRTAADAPRAGPAPNA